MQALQVREATGTVEVDRRRYQRVRLSLLGRCMFPARRECPCQLTEISPGADGQTPNVRGIDMSLSGAASATAMRPPIGSPGRLGRLGARVVRHFNHGIGIEFMRLMSEAAIEQTIEREYF